MPDFLRSTPLTWWLVASLCAYLAASNALWRLQGWTDGRGAPVGSLTRRIARGPWPGIAAFAYHIGLPYAALLLGKLDVRVAGMVVDDWVRSAGMALLLGLTAAVFMRVNDRWAQRAAVTDERRSAGSIAGRLWHAVFVQAHLGFYRAVCLPLVGPYNGGWLALGLVAVEWLPSPAWRQAWQDDAGRRSASFNLILALTATVLFLLTSNLWLCLAMHAVLGLLLRIDPPTTARELAGPGA